MSSARRSLAVRLFRRGLDLYLNDSTSFRTGEQYAEFLQALLEFEDLQTFLEPQFENDIPPNHNHITHLYKAMRLGMCFYGEDSVCNARTYHPEFGFTKEIATSGIDLQITAFLKTAKNYFLNEDFGPSNNDYKLLEQLMLLLDTSIPVFQSYILEYHDDMGKSMITTLFGLAGGIIALILLLHFTGVFPHVLSNHSSGQYAHST
jgi:hypothetical protein